MKDKGMKKFKVGTMNEVVYPAQGSFDDWAYAVTKFPEIITKCGSKLYNPYPLNMSNALFFLI